MGRGYGRVATINGVRESGRRVHGIRSRSRKSYRSSSCGMNVRNGRGAIRGGGYV